MITVAVRIALVVAIEQPGRGRRGIEHEREFAALRQQRGAIDRLAVAEPEHPRDDVDAGRFRDHVGRHGGEDQRPVAREHGEVERHADAEEEQPEQDAAERLDVDLELMPEARFRQHHAGEECAHRHRQAAQLHRQRCAEHDQERGRRHHLARLRIGEDAEHRIEQPAPGREQRRDRGERDADRKPACAGGGLLRTVGARNATSASSGTMARSSSSRVETSRWPCGVAVSPRSSRICMTMAVEESTKPMAARNATIGGKPASDADAGQQRAAGRDLRDAEPENIPPQAPQPRRLHLEPDHEQEHHDAELGDMQDRLRIGEQPQSERADGEAGGEIAEHGAEAGALEQRNRDHGRAQERDHVDQIGTLFRRRHRALRALQTAGILVYPKTLPQPAARIDSKGVTC